MSLVLENITKRFGEPPAEVIRGISLKIDDGDFVAVTGRSGSGKSTLLYLMSTLDSPTSGNILYGGTNVRDFPQRELHAFRNSNIGFVFQFHYLLPDLNILENVLMPAFKRNLVREKREYAMELLRRFGLEDRIFHRPSQISGGERQRVAIARALVLQPPYLFADEPTGSLDSINGEKVMTLLRDANEKLGATVVMVTHDPTFAGMARRQIHLTDGRLA